jgi:hypothetical protein
MQWFESKGRGNNQGNVDPGRPAIYISYGHRNAEVERVRFRLSADFIKQARLQRGDRLQAGISDCSTAIGFQPLSQNPQNRRLGSLCLRRNPAGNAISGVGFANGKSEGNSGCPYVSFQQVTYPQVVQWALAQDKNIWIELLDMGEHFET